MEASPALRETDYLAEGNDSSFAMRVASNYHCGGNLDTRTNLCQLPVTRFGRATSDELNYREVDVEPGECRTHHGEGGGEDRGDQ